MSVFLKRRKLGKPVSVNYCCKAKSKKKELERNEEERKTIKDAINAAMSKIREKHPNMNVGDIICMSVEGKHANQTPLHLRNSTEKERILRQFVDEANYYCVKHKKKPLF